MKKLTILCVDDELTVLQSLREELEGHFGKNYYIEIAENAKDALQIISEAPGFEQEIAVVIADQLMPGMKGDQLLAYIHSQKPSIKNILLTGQASVEDIGNAVNKAKLFRYISKPWDTADLILTVEEALKFYQLDIELNSRIQMLAELNEASSTLSEEIELSRLFKKLLIRAKKYTLATRCALFVRSFQAASIIAFELDQAQELVLNQELDPHTFPLSIVEKTFKDKKTIIYHTHTPGEDLYLDKFGVKSVYCAFIEKKGLLEVVLYMENRTKPWYFNLIYCDFLKILLKQASISLNNALLYADLEKKVIERTDQIEKQKQEITESINYARLIQFSLLPEVSELRRWFPQSFVFYKPKDIVSGDFYWFAEEQDYFFIAAADCTGHGVPGAFMSVLGCSQLNEIVHLEKKISPELILNTLDSRVIEHLHSEEKEAKVNDGMDIAIVRFSKAEPQKLYYAGANRSLVILRKGEVLQIQADRMPIGYFNPILGEVERKSFNCHQAVLEKGDRIYMFSDGITDQFGSSGQKKLSKKRFLHFLIENSHIPMEGQNKVLEAFLEDWQGEEEQTDDILVIGLEV
jgi:serine phosphatase RsbU (regulator of sigma subunit)/FixJ family two-component response regulator